MSNITPTEQALVEALNAWTTNQGVVLTQVNPRYFMQLLRERGFEIVNSTDLIRIRYEHKWIREQVNVIFRIATAVRTKILQLDEKELIKDADKPETKSTSRKE